MTPLKAETVRLLAEPAIETARRRWPGLGGWVNYDPLAEPTPWSVGIHRSTPHGVERVVLGRGGTPDRAFVAADRREAHEGEPHKPRPSSIPREGLPYPIAGDLLDDLEGQ